MNKYLRNACDQSITHIVFDLIVFAQMKQILFLGFTVTLNQSIRNKRSIYSISIEIIQIQSCERTAIDYEKRILD